ncbi:MAG: menaquinone biosynthesis protein [Nitrospinae bacterium]|nr:menaquinone biosynthesis protein [Nitrospinota bacterium]
MTSTPARPKVGFHDFLNSRPILHPFRHGLVDMPFELVIDTPANLAERFHGGELDMALIPSVEYGLSPDAVIVPVVCIASLGRVETVLLFSEMGIEDIESVSVDPKSRSSVAMLKILFKEKFGRDITIVKGGENPAHMLRAADAGLVIGDAAFGVDREKYVVHDMGELWYQYSGRPFVHAALCARRGAKWPSAIKAIETAKEEGKNHRELIARQEAKGLVSAETYLHYLTERIYYDLGKEEKSGLEFFLSAAKAQGLVKRDTLEFYNE